MINNFIRDRSYFQTLRDNKNYVDSFNLDYQFSSFINYINNVLRIAINSIVSTAIPGVVGSANYYLKNIGDGNTEWSPMQQFTNYSLTFNKLMKVNAGSVLINNNVGKLDFSVTNISNLVMQKDAHNNIIWEKIQTQSIENEAITYKKIKGLIGKEYLSLNIVPIEWLAGTILGRHFHNESITSEKFKKNSISSEKFDEQYFYPKVLSGFNIQKNHIKNFSISASRATNVWSNAFSVEKPITRGKIAPQTIHDNMLYRFFSYPDLASFRSKHLSTNFRLTSNKLMKHGVEEGCVASCFTPEVVAAFRAKGCLG